MVFLIITFLCSKHEVSAVDMSNFTTLPEKSVNVEVLRDFLFSSNEIGANMKNRCASLCYLVSKFEDLCDFHIYDGKICSLGNFHNLQRRRIAIQPNGTYFIQYNKGSFSNISIYYIVFCSKSRISFTYITCPLFRQTLWIFLLWNRIFWGGQQQNLVQKY